MEALINSFGLVFISEMGDKTQLATVALGAKYASPFLVTSGTTFGMLGADDTCTPSYQRSVYILWAWDRIWILTSMNIRMLSAGRVDIAGKSEIFE